MQLKQIHKKVLLSAVVLVIGVLSYTSLLDALFQKKFFKELDEKGNIYFDEAIKRAIYTFAIVRGINGVISVAQGTDIAVSPAGIGVQLAVGEALDPVNDLVERFSWVMLVSITSLGIQKILMEMGTWFGFKILLSFSMVIIFIGIWMSRFSKINLVSAGYKLILVSVVIRFCIPATAIVSEKTYNLFLKKKYTESVQSLEEVSREIKDTSQAQQDDKSKADDPGYLDTLKTMYENTKEIVDIKKKISFLKDKISKYATYTMNLIIVFLLQTVIIPVLVLYALIRFVGHIYGKNTISNLSSPNISHKEC
ncbi:hypothetical protein [Desulfonema magnum]|uniref:Uncharacterized protein n=1 Tax=Desulfonema magnum TaxID=45655 RepID=A0A975BND4_9BACT|nr:hypothetical protein [Desulfonema magnum]QTA88383.1 Uncharacterized protein dnm_044280 [Desulfonema magnum]